MKKEFKMITRKEMIEKLKNENERLRNRKKKIVRNYLRPIMSFDYQQMWEYLNTWADLHKEHNPIAFPNGKRTEWANGYAQAIRDVFDKLEKLKKEQERENETK